MRRRRRVPGGKRSGCGVKSIRVHCLVANDMIFQQRMEVALSVSTREESIDALSQLGKCQVGWDKQSVADEASIRNFSCQTRLL